MVGRSWVIFAFGVLAGLLLSSISSPWTPWSNSGETSGATVPGVWASRSSSGSKSASLSSAASKTHHLINATYREEAARGDSNRVPRSNVGTATRAPTPVLRTTTSKAQSPFDLDSKEGLRAAVDQAAITSSMRPIVRKPPEETRIVYREATLALQREHQHQCYEPPPRKHNRLST